MASIRSKLCTCALLALLSAGCALPGLLPGSRRAADGAQYSVAEVEGAIRHAQRWQRGIYGDARWFTDGWRKRPCDETEGDDCFQGDRECPLCLWPEDRRTLRQLGEKYDETAQIVLQGEEGVHPELLNWLAGQRVGVWTRMGELERARTAADECHAAFWWCVALAAFVDHHSGDHAAAEEKFGRVLRMMPQNRACYWNETALFGDTLAFSVGHQADGRDVPEPEPWGSAVCPEPDEIEVFWTLADPLWTRPGNDRRSEHYARHVDLHIHQQHQRAAMTCEPEPLCEGRWTGDSTEISPGIQARTFWTYHLLAHHSPVVRYGWPTGIVSRDRFPRVVYGGFGQSFVLTTSLDDALRAPASLFEPGTARSGETYAPPYGPIAPFPLQYGFFLRDGTEHIVIRSTVPHGPDATASDSEPASVHGTSDGTGDVPAGPADGVRERAAGEHAAPGRARERAAWKLAAWNGSDWRHAAADVSGDTLIVRLDTPWEAQIISLEAEHADGAWRARSGTAPPDGTGDGPRMSSVVLLDGMRELPRTLDDAARQMLPALAANAGAPVVAYWEFYADDTFNANIEVIVQRVDDRSLFARAIGRSPQPPLRVYWEELLEPEDGMAPRSFDIGTNQLEPGSYDIRVRLALHTGAALAVTTSLTILDPR